ncbi:MAG: hypothetical protein HN568_02965 [Phycisphaerae bacterium]|jgi:hypothetical protein|nr:hypothetical protein [Phycisphaerae bacterium]
MYFKHFTLVVSLFLITGCNSTGSLSQNQRASKIVSQVQQSHIEKPNIQMLEASFSDNDNTSKYSGAVIELSGEVLTFSLTDDDLYTVTIKQDDSQVVCVFDDSIADFIGGGRSVSNGAIVTVRGQCFASGLFSSNSFTLDGCSLVNN